MKENEKNEIMFDALLRIAAHESLEHEMEELSLKLSENPEEYKPPEELDIRIRKMISGYRTNYRVSKLLQTCGKAVASIAIFFMIASTIAFSASIVALANTSIWSGIVTLGKIILNNAPNERLTSEDIDTIWTNSTRTYDSIAEAIEKEELDIAYPKWLPDDFTEKEVIISYYGNYIELDVKFESQHEILMLSINNRQDKFIIGNSMEQYFVGEVVHYIKEEEGRLYMNCKIKDFTYNASFNGNKDTLINIIDSMY